MRTLKLAAIAGLALAAAFAVAAEGGRPKAVPVAPIQDFDVVNKGDAIVYDFEIRNDGDAVLEINDVRPACGCTVARYDRKIAPGAVGKVSATLDTSTFAGPISKSIAVFTNDTDNPKLQLVIKAKVRPHVAAVPGYTRYNYVQGEPVRPLIQKVFASDGTAISVVKIDHPGYVRVSHRTASVDELESSGPEHQLYLEVLLDPATAVGPLRDYVTVHLDHPKQNVVKIPVTGFVRPRQHATPDKLDLGTIDRSALPMKQVVAFTNFATNGVEITDIETGYEAMTVKIDKAGHQPGHRFRLTVTFGDALPSGALDGVIKIHSTDSQKPVYELPFTAEVL